MSKPDKINNTALIIVKTTFLSDMYAAVRNLRAGVGDTVDASDEVRPHNPNANHPTTLLPAFPPNDLLAPQINMLHYCPLNHTKIAIDIHDNDR